MTADASVRHIPSRVPADGAHTSPALRSQPPPRPPGEEGERRKDLSYHAPSGPKGRRHVAWGASPRKGCIQEIPKPRRGDGGFGRTAAVAPPGLGEIFVHRLPGAEAPGYMPPALRACFGVVTSLLRIPRELQK